MYRLGWLFAEFFASMGTFKNFLVNAMNKEIFKTYSKRLGVLVTIVLACITLFDSPTVKSFVKPPKSHDEMWLTLRDSYNKKDFYTLNEQLDGIKEAKGNEDLYYFYKGLVALKTKGIDVSPHFYFEKIPVDSSLYLDGQAEMYHEVLEGKWLNHREVGERIINNLKYANIKSPLYYFALIVNNQNITYEWASDQYKEFAINNSFYMNFDSFNRSISVSVNTPISFNIKRFDEIDAVTFWFLISMIETSKNKIQCIDSKTKLDNLLRLRKGVKTIEVGMKHMSHDFPQPLLSHAQNKQCENL